MPWMCELFSGVHIFSTLFFIIWGITLSSAHGSYLALSTGMPPGGSQGANVVPGIEGHLLHAR